MHMAKYRKNIHLSNKKKNNPQTKQEYNQILEGWFRKPKRFLPESWNFFHYSWISFWTPTYTYRGTLLRIPLQYQYLETKHFYTYVGFFLMTMCVYKGIYKGHNNSHNHDNIIVIGSESLPQNYLHSIQCFDSHEFPYHSPTN